MKPTQAASPLDVAAALCGQKGDGDTEAALKRLAKVLPKQVVQILRERPPAMVAHMRNRDRVLSQLKRSVGKPLADEVWRAEEFEKQILDAGGHVRADPKQTQYMNKAVPELQIQ